jgi:predicted nucleic acid-binding protein
MVTFELLSFDAVIDFDGAMRVYRRCRAAGVNPRGLLDCMIAAVAWRRQAALLSHDADMDRLAGVIGIAVDPGSLRA